MCRFYRFLYSIAPLKKIQSVLIMKHFSVCEACRESTPLEKVRGELEVIKDWANKENSIGPEIKSDLRVLKRTKVEPQKRLELRPIKVWRWTVSFITVIILASVVFLIHSSQKTNVKPEEVLSADIVPKVILKRAELRGQKARPIIYQTPKVSIIFLVEDKESGGIDDKNKK